MDLNKEIEFGSDSKFGLDSIRIWIRNLIGFRSDSGSKNYLDSIFIFYLNQIRIQNIFSDSDLIFILDSNRIRV